MSSKTPWDRRPQVKFKCGTRVAGGQHAARKQAVRLGVVCDDGSGAFILQDLKILHRIHPDATWFWYPNSVAVTWSSGRVTLRARKIP